MAIKLLALDIDGTLVPPHTGAVGITDRNKEALKKAQEMGVLVTLCTGRALGGAREFAEALDLRGPLILFNGALIQDLKQENTLRDLQMEESMARDVAMIAEEMKITYRSYHGDHIVERTLADPMTNYINFQETYTYEWPDTFPENHSGISRMLIGGPEERLKEFEEKVRTSIVPEPYQVYYKGRRRMFLEVLHPEATKGHGLKALREALGLDISEVMAVGDNDNDVDMFREAGVSVCMGNGTEEAIRAAKYMTGDFTESGVAQAVEKWILQA